ncbi:MAG: hypothetical protein ACTS78_00765 [Arsenophonus sp. NC-WZS1-MAG3]
MSTINTSAANPAIPLSRQRLATFEMDDTTVMGWITIVVSLKLDTERTLIFALNAETQLRDIIPAY